MHDPQRDPFFEGLWADIQEGIDEANSGELLDGEDAFAELLDEDPATATVETDWQRYRLTPRVRHDVTAIRRYIAEVSREPERGVVAVIERIRDRCRLLESAPAQGRIRDDAPIAGEVLSIPAWPYVIFYRIAASNVVQVLRVIDGRRDLGTAFLSD